MVQYSKVFPGKLVFSLAQKVGKRSQTYALRQRRLRKNLGRKSFIYELAVTRLAKDKDQRGLGGRTLIIIHRLA